MPVHDPDDTVARGPVAEPWMDGEARSLGVLAVAAAAKKALDSDATILRLRHDVAGALRI